MAAFISKAGASGTFTTTAAEHGLLDTAEGSSGSCWIYVQASGAVTQYDLVQIDEDGTARAVTATTAAAGDGHRLGVAQVAFADNEYGWIAVAGSDIQVRVRASCAADAVLWVTDSVGIVDDISVSAGSISIYGMTITTAATASGVQAEEAILSYPMLNLGS